MSSREYKSIHLTTANVTNTATTNPFHAIYGIETIDFRCDNSVIIKI